MLSYDPQSYINNLRFDTLSLLLVGKEVLWSPFSPATQFKQEDLVNMFEIKKEAHRYCAQLAESVVKLSIDVWM